MRQLKISQSITYRDSQSLEKYLSEIAKVDMIAPEEEAVLARKIRKGDNNALQKLVSANLRFVVSVAKQYPNTYLSLNDLVNEGNLGLIKAAQRFDESRGFKFISYAVWWIRQSIIQAIAEQSRLIRLPVNRSAALNKLNRTFAQLEQQYEREPTADELSDSMQIHVDEIRVTQKSGTRHVSMDAPFREGEEQSFHDVLGDTLLVRTDNSVSYTDSLSIDMERMMGCLTGIQKQIVKLYFGIGKKEPMRLESIAVEMGLTKERIRQIKDKALVKLRASSRSGMLKDYLCQ